MLGPPAGPGQVRLCHGALAYRQHCEHGALVRLGVADASVQHRTEPDRKRSARSVIAGRCQLFGEERVATGAPVYLVDVTLTDLTTH